MLFAHHVLVSPQTSSVNTLNQHEDSSRLILSHLGSAVKPKRFLALVPRQHAETHVWVAGRIHQLQLLILRIAKSLTNQLYSLSITQACVSDIKVQHSDHGSNAQTSSCCCMCCARHIDPITPHSPREYFFKKRGLVSQSTSKVKRWWTSHVFGVYAPYHCLCRASYVKCTNPRRLLDTLV